MNVKGLGILVTHIRGALSATGREPFRVKWTLPTTQQIAHHRGTILLALNSPVKMELVQQLLPFWCHPLAPTAKSPALFAHPSVQLFVVARFDIHMTVTCLEFHKHVVFPVPRNFI